MIIIRRVAKVDARARAHLRLDTAQDKAGGEHSAGDRQTPSLARVPIYQALGLKLRNGGGGERSPLSPPLPVMVIRVHFREMCVLVSAGSASGGRQLQRGSARRAKACRRMRARLHAGRKSWQLTGKLARAKLKNGSAIGKAGESRFEPSRVECCNCRRPLDIAPARAMSVHLLQLASSRMWRQSRHALAIVKLFQALESTTTWMIFMKHTHTHTYYLQKFGHTLAQLC